MASGLNLQLKVSGKLVMTPQLQLAIKLLQMQTADLQDFVDQEVLDNPFLSKEDGTEEHDSADYTPDETLSATADSLTALEREDFATEEPTLDHTWENMYDTGMDAGTPNSPGGDEATWENTATHEKSLKDVLREQLGLATTDAVLGFLVRYLIDAMDDAGYIHINLTELPHRLKVSPEKVAEALQLVQSFEPAGVGARHLAECLLLQLQAEGGATYAEKVVLEHLDVLANRDLRKLARLGQCDVENIEEAVAKITSLNPKPGLQYGREMAGHVVPDVVVVFKEGKWMAELNVDAMPKLLLNQRYTAMAGQAKGHDKGFMAERMSRAQWLIKSLEQRARTIHKTTNCIVQMQEAFFNEGVESLKPMTLKTVAEAIDVHESTVSRVTSGKYMQTPMGVFELKYFFSSAVHSTGGNVLVASESVRSMIQRLVHAENPKKPLSDEKIVALLKREGVDVARRTVAKYREGLNIPPSSRRRVRVLSS